MNILLATAFLSMAVEVAAQTAVIDFSKVYQRIDGFGASSAWHGVLTDLEVNTAFKNDSDNQLGLSILRIRISPDTTSWYKEKGNAQKAKACGALILATPWSMPASMKTNDSLIGGELKASSYAEYAAYLKRFCDSMKVIDVISLQNEPDWHPKYESVSWSAVQFRKFCRENAQSIGTPVMMPEAYGFRTSLSDSTLDDSIAASHIAYIGGHLYGAKPFTYTKAINLKKMIWMTEYNMNGDDADTCMILAKQILDCMYCSMNAYIWWYLRQPGCNIINTDCSFKKKGYVMAQFSKFIRPGYYRVDATYEPQSQVNVVAFKGAQNVIVAINTSASPKSQTFTFSGASVNSVRKITSSSTKNLAKDSSITIKNSSFTTILDAQSVNTFVFDTPSNTILFNNGFTAQKLSSISSPMNMSPRYVYLVNGKRLQLQAVKEQWNLPNGIYLMQEVPVSGIKSEKSVLILNR